LIFIILKNNILREKILREEISTEFNFADERVKMGEFRGI